MESKNFLKWFFATSTSTAPTSSPSASMPSPVVDSSSPTPPPDPQHNALLVSDALLKLDFQDKEEKDEEKSDPDDDDGVGEFIKDKNDAEGQGDTAAAGATSSVSLGLGFGRRNKFPVRSEDCAFYIKTGTCKFGSNCKFNHPLRNKIHPQVPKEKDKEESRDRTAQVECKYYLTPGGCKYGESCRFNHSKGNPMAPPPAVELNFLGLPIRPREKECPFYMRTGTCKFASVCKFNHPDPTSGGDPPVEYSNGGSTTMQNIAQFPLWSPSGTLTNESIPYVPMMYSPGQVVSSPNGEWNGYQFSLNPQRQNMPPRPAYVVNSPMGSESQIYTNQPRQMAFEEFPERPGLPECSYFLKTGDCKFKSSCKYHHSKDRVQKSPQVALSDKGLPLRPDQNICSYYSRYGICKFGPSCKFDHSMQFPPSELEMQSLVEISSGDDDPAIQQQSV